MSTIPIELRPKHINDTGSNFKRLRYIRCPECGAPMALRMNRQSNDLFYGCTKYPECTGSRQSDDVDLHCNDLLKSYWHRAAPGTTFDVRKAFASTVAVERDSDVGLSRRRKAKKRVSRTDLPLTTSAAVRYAEGNVVVLKRDWHEIRAGSLVLVECVIPGTDAARIRYGGSFHPDCLLFYLRGLGEEDSLLSFDIPAGTSYNPGSPLKAVQQDSTTLICRGVTNNGVWTTDVMRFEFDDLVLVGSAAHDVAGRAFHGTESSAKFSSELEAAADAVFEGGSLLISEDDPNMIDVLDMDLPIDKMAAQMQASASASTGKTPIDDVLDGKLPQFPIEPLELDQEHSEKSRAMFEKAMDRHEREAVAHDEKYGSHHTPELSPDEAFEFLDKPEPPEPPKPARIEDVEIDLDFGLDA